MKIVIANDHAATDYKFEIKKYIEDMGIEVVNVGTDDSTSVDYPLYAYKACKEVIDKKADLAILICGTGLGMSIAANKIKGIRAVVCSEEFSASMSRKHNDANVLCLGQRVVGIELAKNIVKTFIENEFLGDRHKKRVDMIIKLENEGMLDA